MMYISRVDIKYMVQAAAPVTTASAVSPQARPKVLLVDDNELFRKVVKKALEMSGLDVYEAENGLRGLESVRVEKPDVIMVDIYMPVMDGMAMLSELKKDELLMKIPVIMVTNVQEELENAVKAGAEEAILKSSVTPKQMVEVCKKYLS